AATASGAGPEIDLRLDSTIEAIDTDPERLRIALVNMLVNARHATPPATKQPVVFATKRTGDRVILTVVDRGVGIDANALAHVSDPYFTPKRGGTGLGLPIAKNIIEGLGGTIAVSSTAGYGTEVRIELPLDAIATQAASSAQAATVDTAQ